MIFADFSVNFQPLVMTFCEHFLAVALATLKIYTSNGVTSGTQNIILRNLPCSQASTGE